MSPPRNHAEEVAAFFAGYDAALAGLTAERAALLARLASLPPEAALAALQRAVLASGGTWVMPGPAGAGGWPASHLGEICVLGVFASGRSPAEIVDNWRAAARRLTRSPK